MRVYWEVDDGYVGNRPRFTEIDDDEILEYETPEDMMQFISDCVQDDFDQRITWYFKNDKDIATKLAELLDQKEE